MFLFAFANLFGTVIYSKQCGSRKQTISCSIHSCCISLWYSISLMYSSTAAVAESTSSTFLQCTKHYQQNTSWPWCPLSWSPSNRLLRPDDPVNFEHYEDDFWNGLHDLACVRRAGLWQYNDTFMRIEIFNIVGHQVWSPLCLLMTWQLLFHSFHNFVNWSNFGAFYHSRRIFIFQCE